MKLFVALFVVATAFVCGHGRLIFENKVFFENVDQLDDTAYDVDNDGDSFHLETKDVDEDNLLFDDSSEDAIDDIFGEQNSAYDNVFGENGLMGCHNGKCEMCLKLWKVKGCFIAEITSEGIKLSFKAFGKTFFSRVIKTDKSFTIKVKKSTLPKSVRKLMKSDLEIKISGVNIAKKQICVQLKFKVKFFGSMKWPKTSPHCFKL